MTERNPNLDLWKSVEKTDPYFTKGFSRGGGFRGTATSSTYLVKKATRMFGPIGIGWGYDVVDEEIISGHDQHKVHKLRIKLWYMWGGQRGEVTHFGQTELVGKNKNGWFTDEEAPKKSLTDALSKCFSMIGFAGDIFLGLYDDNGYVNTLKREFKDADEFQDDYIEQDNAPTSAESDARSDAPVAEDDNQDRDAPPPRKASKKRDEQQPPANDDNAGDPLPSLDARLMAAIDKRTTFDEIIKLMTDGKTQKALKELDKETAKSVREYAQARMKELGWVVASKAKKDEPKGESQAPSEDDAPNHEPQTHDAAAG